MQQLLSFFIALSLLKRNPQDLPASTSLLAVFLLANVTVGWLGTINYFQTAETAFLASVFDAILLAAMIFITLALARKRGRFVQVVTTFYGLGVLFGFILWPLNMLADLKELAPLIALINLCALVWIHLVLGHVLRHALEVRLWTGFVLATGYTLIGMDLINYLFPTVTPLN